LLQIESVLQNNADELIELKTVKTIAQS
jgi:hypothetical protein